MVEFSKVVRFRGKHAAYIQFLSTERGKDRLGGVNVFQRIMDAYMVAIIVGLKYERYSKIDDTPLKASDIFGNEKEYKNKMIPSSEIPADTVHSCQDKLNHLYRLVMLTDDSKNLSNEEKIANAFKYDTNTEVVENNIEYMNGLARGGLECLYDMFKDANSENEILQKQLQLYDDLGSFIVNESYVG